MCDLKNEIKRMVSRQSVIVAYPGHPPFRAVGF